MWRVYYSDGSTYNGDPENAPGVGIVVIVQDDPDVGRMLMCKWDYYCWHDGQWWGHDLIGTVDCLAQPGFNRVLVGRTVSQDLWKKIHAAAANDPDFQPKSALARPEEPRGTLWPRGADEG